MPDSKTFDRMNRDLEKAASRIRSAKDILVVAHIDADGISSALPIQSAISNVSGVSAFTFQRNQALTWPFVAQPARGGAGLFLTASFR